MASGSSGYCYLCGTELGKTAMKNHVLKAHAGGEAGQRCSLLKIEGAYNKDYWLLMDVPIDKTLAAVDKFLRKIWLECCGHLSGFYGSGHYQSQIGKGRRLSDFLVGDRLFYEYDFGTPTECVITVMGSTVRPP